MKIMTMGLLVGLCLLIATIQPALAQELAKDQTVFLGIEADDMRSIDPIAPVAAQDMVMRHHLYGALVRTPDGDCLGKREPDLATKWEISRDNLTWTFYLRKGVKWHWNYGEVTAEDVVYSLNRVKDSKFSAYRGSYVNFTAIKAIDKYTVQIVTAKPDPYLLSKVSNNLGGWIVCKSALEKAGKFDQGVSPVKEECIGTGPFKFVEYRSKDRVVLARNDDYWAGKPIVEKLVVKYIPDDGARELALLKGEIAACKSLNDSKWIANMRSKGLILDALGPADMDVIYFNTKMKPFDDKRVREAFAYAADKTSIRMLIPETRTYCTSPVPDGYPEHVETSWGKYNVRDVDLAKRLLAQAGYPDGIKVKLFMSTAFWYKDIMVLFQNQLKEAGIDLDMNFVAHAEYLTKVRQGVNPFVIWGIKYPTAIQWVRPYYHSDAIVGTPKGELNFMMYSNSKVDALIEEAETTLDDTKRMGLFAQIQRMIAQDFPSMPVVVMRSPRLRHPWLDLGYKPLNDIIWSYEIGVKTKVLKH